jgi:spoIIIJ-associated protein
MEWVETTGKTVDEAVNAALDQLGVDKTEADVEVLDEPKTGLFGRVRTEARIRARVAPVKPRAKEERSRKSAKPVADSVVAGSESPSAPRAARAPRPVKATTGSAETRGNSSREPRNPREPREARQARPPRDRDPANLAPNEKVATAGIAFLEGLVEAFGFEANVTSHVVAEGITEFRVAGNDLGVMIGPKAQTLTSIQDLLRTVVYYQIEGDAGRILLDVGGYRERRRKALEEFTRKVAADVLASGERRALEPMNPADRKVVHDTAGSIDGISSLSEGEDEQRRVVLSLTA